MNAQQDADHRKARSGDGPLSPPVWDALIPLARANVGGSECIGINEAGAWVNNAAGSTLLLPWPWLTPLARRTNV